MLRMRRLDEFEAKFWRIATPGSGECGRFLRREDIADQYGDVASIAEAFAWLRRSGRRISGCLRSETV